MYERIIIPQTVFQKNYCKLEHTMCEFANDRGYCVKTGCSKRIIINEKPTVNHNLAEFVRCKECMHKPKELQYCRKLDMYTMDDFFCAEWERRKE